MIAADQTPADANPAGPAAADTVPFSGRTLLLDIEGTTSSVSYVFDVLFPYARTRLRSFLADNWDDESVAQARRLIARDAGWPTDFGAAVPVAGPAPAAATQLDDLVAHLEQLMDADSKSTGLKELQGLIWRDGFLSGALTAHVYPDVPGALERWTAAGKRVCIFSSGSIGAQRLFMAHTVAGDLTRYFVGHYDTTIGPKRAAASYAAIAADLGDDPRQILFVSDIAAELEAAAAAGMQTALAMRPGNAPQSADYRHRVIESFDQITVA